VDGQDKPGPARLKKYFAYTDDELKARMGKLRAQSLPA